MGSALKLQSLYEGRPEWFIKMDEYIDEKFDLMMDVEPDMEPEEFFRLVVINHPWLSDITGHINWTPVVPNNFDTEMRLQIKREIGVIKYYDDFYDGPIGDLEMWRGRYFDDEEPEEEVVGNSDTEEESSDEESYDEEME